MDSSLGLKDTKFYTFPIITIIYRPFPYSTPVNEHKEMRLRLTVAIISLRALVPKPQQVVAFVCSIVGKVNITCNNATYKGNSVMWTLGSDLSQCLQVSASISSKRVKHEEPSMFVFVYKNDKFH